MNAGPSIPAVARAAATACGAADAVVAGGARYSFERLDRDRVEAAKAFSAAGVLPGDRVAIWAPNSYEWIVCLLGLQSAGGVVVPLNTRYRSAEATFILERSRARVLVTATGFLGIDYEGMLAGHDLPHLEKTVVIGATGQPHVPAGSGAMSWSEFLQLGHEVSDDEINGRVDAIAETDVSDLIFTSGTTGHPKGVMATHGQSIRVFTEWAEIVGLRRGDRYLLVNPMFHTFGYKAGIVASLLAGATVVPLQAFDPAGALETIAAENISVLPGPPTLYHSLLHHPALATTDTASLRLAVTGAAAIPVDLVRQIKEELGFETVLTAYGLTEATGFVSATRPGDDIETIATTSGRAIDGVEVRVLGPDGCALSAGRQGEIVVRGYNVMQGYFEDPEQTGAAIRDGWLHTGDIGVLDPSGNLRITDRLKDMFIVGGFNAYPAEIEQLVTQHPLVAQAAVIGVSDERLGEVGVAFVVPVAGAEIDEAEIVAWSRHRMANFKVPRRVMALDELPLNASGKVLKDELRRRFKETAGATGEISSAADERRS
ncbi:MAG: FadD3 family acyl-CoA ligase [Acidimicrobiales bacterium]